MDGTPIQTVTSHIKRKTKLVKMTNMSMIVTIIADHQLTRTDEVEMKDSTTKTEADHVKVTTEMSTNNRIRVYNTITTTMTTEWADTIVNIKVGKIIFPHQNQTPSKEIERLNQESKPKQTAR